MDGCGIAKATIRTLATCGLAVAVATAAGAQDVETAFCEIYGRIVTGPACLDSSQPEEPASKADARIDHYFDSDGNRVNCNVYDPDGNYVFCPRDDLPEDPGFIDKARQQWDKAKEKLEELNPLNKLDALKENLTSSESPWCHEIRNPRPRVNCMEWIPPAASTPGAGGTTINVHPPSVATADPFDSVYDSYQPPAAAQYGRTIGRIVKRKAEQERREAAQRRLLSTLDRQEGRTEGLRVKSGYQASVGATVVPSKSPGATPRHEVRKRPSISGATYDCRPGSSLYTPRTCARLGFAPKKPTKNYAVPPTDYSRKPAEEHRAKAAKSRVPRKAPTVSASRKCPDGSDYHYRYRYWKHIMNTGSNQEICRSAEWQKRWPGSYAWCTDPCAL